MAHTTSANIKRAIVQTLRASAPLVAASTGGIHWRKAPRKVSYPFLVVSRVAAPYQRDWDQLEIRSLWDVIAYAENSVGAENLDTLVGVALNEAELTVDGQATLLCQRSADIDGGEDTDDEGKQVFQIGGSYRIWTTQPR
jgi:hypothetical protein